MSKPLLFRILRGVVNTMTENALMPDLRMRIDEALPKLVKMLLEERGQGKDIPGEPKAQWDLFRALVNTRPPMPAPDGFLGLQDGMLKDILAYRGITDPKDIAALPGHPHMKLWRGDITTLAADTIVNAANSQMLGCFVPGHHCIDNAIHTFAGIQLRLECARIMEAQGFAEPTGMAKVTDAFDLPSKHIIHTVGPIAEGVATKTDRALLANCYTACLDAAFGQACSSIAFCCISTGVFGFPKEEAAKIAIDTADEWLANNIEDHGDFDVIFNVFSAEDEAIYRRLL